MAEGCHCTQSVTAPGLVYHASWWTCLLGYGERAPGAALWVHRRRGPAGEGAVVRPCGAPGHQLMHLLLG